MSLNFYHTWRSQTWGTAYRIYSIVSRPWL